MVIPITCAGCKAAFEVPDRLAGKTIRCTSCKAEMAVPQSLLPAATGSARKPFGSGSATQTPLSLDDDDPKPAKASGPPKPKVAPKPAAKPASKAVVELDEDEDDTKAAKAKPAKAGAVKGAVRKRRDDDDDDDDDEKPARRKNKNESGGAGPMVAIIAASAIGLAVVAGIGIWLMSGKKPETAQSDSTPATTDTTTTTPATPAQPAVPAQPGGGQFGGIGNFDRIGTPGAWAPYTGDGFNVDFPGTPETKAESMPGGISMNLIGVGAKDGPVALAMKVQLPRAVITASGNDPKKVLDVFVQGMSNSPMFKNKPIANTTVDGHPAKEIGLNDKQGEGKLRVTAANDRVYVFIAGGPYKAGKPTMPPADVNRFFDSIKITYRGGAVAVGPPPTPPAGDPMPPAPSTDPPPTPPTPPPPPMPPFGGVTGSTDVNVKAKLDAFFTAAFDTDNNELFTLESRLVGGRVLGSLRRYSYPDFRPLNKFKLPHLGFRSVVDAKAGLLYVAVATAPNKTLGDAQLDRASASGDIAVYDLKAIRDGKSADGKELKDDSDLKPVATITLKNTIHGLELSDDGASLYVLVTGGTGTKRVSSVLLIDTATRKESKRTALPAQARDFTKGGDGKNLVIIEEYIASKKSSGIQFFDIGAFAVVKTIAFRDAAALDVAPQANGWVLATVMPLDQAAGSGIGKPQYKFRHHLIDADGVEKAEMDLGVGAHAANGGYVAYNPANKKLFVSSWHGAGLDVYDVTDASAAGGGEAEGRDPHRQEGGRGRTLLRLARRQIPRVQPRRGDRHRRPGWPGRVAVWRVSGRRALGRLLLAEAVADAADGFDQLAGAAGLCQLLPQRFDVNVDGALQHHGAVADGSLHQLLAAERPPRLTDEAFQQAELGRSQVERLIVEGDAVPHAVDLHAGRFGYVARLALAVHPPQQRLHLRQEHLVRERLAHVVVGPE